MAAAVARLPGPRRAARRSQGKRRPGRSEPTAAWTERKPRHPRPGAGPRHGRRGGSRPVRPIDPERAGARWPPEAPFPDFLVFGFGPRDRHLPGVNPRTRGKSGAENGGDLARRFSYTRWGEKGFGSASRDNEEVVYLTELDGCDRHGPSRRGAQGRGWPPRGMGSGSTEGG